MESEKTTPRATKPTVVAAYCRHYASRVPSSGIIRDTCSQNTYSLDFEPMEVNVDIAEQARFEQLEKEVKILNLKLEGGLIDYLNVGRAEFWSSIWTAGL